jgi:hypothetical protein
VASFLYKPAFDGSPMQIMAEFSPSELDLEREWVLWLESRGFPVPMMRSFASPNLPRDSHVWVPSENHFIEHRLRWGGKVAKDEE